VLIRADQPWESGPRTQIGVYSCVLKEGDLVRVWYFSSRSGDSLYQRVAYAESEDGLHFRKPILGLHEAVGSKENNIVLPGRIGGCSVWIDPNAPPEHRYKNQAKVYPSAKFHMQSSPDGLNWKFFSQIEPGHGGWDTQSIVFWDPRIQRYALYTRFWMSHRHKTAPAPNDYRTVRRLESDDLKNWEKQTLVMQPDDLDRAIQKTEPGRPPVNYYGADVFRYEEAEHVYIMLAQAFWQWQRREKKGLGPSGFDVRLSTSRDGIKFRRAGDRKPFMAMGPSGRFDSRGVWAMPNPIRMGDELWIYYVGSNRDHDDNIDPTADGKHLTGISGAVLRRDGFVSAYAGYEGGQITTPPIRFAGRRLELNVDTSGGGSIVVEILDTSGQPIAGYAASDAIAVNGNSVRMPVLWRGGDDVASLAGRDIRLRFYMRDCKLYAFQFRD
ncbi:MAG: hypothetical protein MK538_07730, partial [Planctomycetes bacterium]|nr:hypothetical protein [Planctomycetota bacterium]